MAQPANAEQALEIARTLAASGAVDLVVIDSAAALAPRLEVEAGMIDSIPRLQSRVLANELRKLSSAIRRGDACILFLNQMRSRPDRGAGEAETSAGAAAEIVCGGARGATSRRNKTKAPCFKNNIARPASDASWSGIAAPVSPARPMPEACKQGVLGAQEAGFRYRPSRNARKMRV